MIQFIVMLLSLAFGHNNANTTTNDNQTTVIIQNDFDPGDGTDPGDTGGDTIPLPPKK